MEFDEVEDGQAVSVKEYLNCVPRGFELVDGHLLRLPIVTWTHCFVRRLLLRRIEDVGGFHNVSFSGHRVVTGDRRFREPDILYVRDNSKWTNDAALALDLVIQALCGDEKDSERNLVTKRREYAAAGFPEYWIVDPAERRIMVLTLADGEYVEHADCNDGDIATSVVLPAFSVDVTQLFDEVGA